MTGPTDPETRAERIATSVREQLDEMSGSRRSFLSRSALLGGTVLALGGAGGSVLAQEEDDEEAAPEMPTESAFDDVAGTDVDVLNYALSLEHLESAFYQEALDTFDEDDFAESDALADYDEEVGADVHGYVEMIAEHEATHVDVLTQAIELLGGTPAEEGSYDFGVETADDFFAAGQEIENLGVAAYAGAAPFVESPDLLATALSIHSVEARHAGLMNGVAGESPFPDAFDSSQSQQDVLDAVSQFSESEEEDEEDEEEEEEDEEEDEDEETPEEETEEETPEDEEDDEEDEEEETETTTEGEGTDGFNETTTEESTTAANETTTIFGNETE